MYRQFDLRDRKNGMKSVMNTRDIWNSIRDESISDQTYNWKSKFIPPYNRAFLPRHEVLRTFSWLDGDISVHK
jgi:hypothetical protein